MPVSTNSTAHCASPFALISDTGAKTSSDIPAGHPCVHMAQQMALIHNGLLRALNASYNQCRGVPPGTQDASDFLIFNQCIYEWLDEHHKTEEDVFFPDVEKVAGVKGLMDTNVEQHHAFEAGMKEFKEYVYETSSNDYNGEKLQNIIAAFGKLVEEHLHDEIPTLLSLTSLDPAKTNKIWKSASSAATSSVDRHRNFPLVFGSQDKTFLLDGLPLQFPDVPFFVPYIVHYVFARRYAGAWRFCPSTSFRAPRLLQFAAR